MQSQILERLCRIPQQQDEALGPVAHLPSFEFYNPAVGTSAGALYDLPDPRNFEHQSL